jgi:hypothetical protein
MRRVFLLLVIVGTFAACSTDAEPDAGASESGDAPSPQASTGVLPEREQFMVGWAEICVAANDDISAINDEVDSSTATTAEVVDGFRRVIARTELVQQQLDELSVPPMFEAFVAEQTERRQERIRLVGEMIAALEAEDEDTVASIDEELTALNIESESEEDANGVSHCA